MDPDANLIEQRHVAQDIMRIWDNCPEDGTYTAKQLNDLSYLAMRLAELQVALDEWIKGGGFLPAGWRKAS